MYPELARRSSRLKQTRRRQRARRKQVDGDRHADHRRVDIARRRGRVARRPDGDGAAAQQRAQQAGRGGESKSLPVRDNIYVLAGAGANIARLGGRDGVFLVDTGPNR